MNLQDAIDREYLVKIISDPLLIQKELEESKYDFQSAKNAIQEKDYKWVIIKCYYSMFHSGKALCFQQGYREKKHIAILLMLQELQKKGKIEKECVYYSKLRRMSHMNHRSLLIRSLRQMCYKPRSYL